MQLSLIRETEGRRGNSSLNNPQTLSVPSARGTATRELDSSATDAGAAVTVLGTTAAFKKKAGGDVKHVYFITLHYGVTIEAIGLTVRFGKMCPS